MALRASIKKSVRFEVFKRDSFTCQYCGQKSPDVVLEIDHITPVAEGGGNDLLNLVTACRDCNSGKSDRRLLDTDAMDKRRSQLENLEHRRQQLEMLHMWHKSLLNLDEDAVAMAADLWFCSTGYDGQSLTDDAQAEIKKLIKRYGFEDVCKAIKEAAYCYLKDNDEEAAAYSKWFWKIGRILNTWRLDRQTPGLSKLLYIRGILRNRIHLYSSSEWKSLSLLKEAHSLCVPMEWLESTAKAASNWSDWKWLMEDAIAKYSTESSEHDEATDGI